MTFDFRRFPVLETERLHLRRIHRDDADAMRDVLGDESVTHYLPDFPPNMNTREGMRSIIRFIEDGYHDETMIRWAVTLKEGDGRYIGSVGLHRWDRHNRFVETGYDLAQKHWRRGIMREALTSVLHFAFKGLDVHRVEADVVKGNIASIKLLETMGFQHEGTKRDRAWMHGQFYDLMFFGLLRGDFAAGRSRRTPTP